MSRLKTYTIKYNNIYGAYVLMLVVGLIIFVGLLSTPKISHAGTIIRMDLHTLLICTALVSFIMMLTMAALFIVSRNEKYLLDWLVCGVLFFVSNLVGIVATQVSLSWIFHPSFANACYLGAHAALFSGVSRCLYGRSTWGLVVIVFVGIYLLNLVPPLVESVELRIVALYPVIAALDISATMALWKHRKEEVGRGYYLLIGILFIFAAQLLIRGYFLLAGVENYPWLDKGLLLDIGSLAVIAFVFLLTISFSVVVTWRKELALREYSFTDHLTGWYNRKALEKVASNEIKRCSRNNFRLAFIVFDIDYFKSVNDRFGHIQGDKALKHVTKIAKQQLRGYDHNFRLGGEEFAVLVSHLKPQDVELLAQRIRKKVARTPLNIEGEAVHLTISVGVAISKNQETSWEDVLKRADDALYRSKHDGRNLVTSYGDLAEA
ncbi:MULTISPECIES: GGDEF domain-containing protein [Pseudoalteromonas]|uniref:GGDEF domain-containing protein n=1 Tax=Pseudoalteromonas TaxID=53246 RepID=UPI0009F87512|nr:MULTISPECIES: GGDEF domain-containing protein [Gammaproteobacteria]UJX26517.1 GGDEF domain-containing protein [Pseudoalteromonas sp. CF6-2]|tara:strand:+ start:12217 stop:13521 length:1305 start_codon:yes stop_codon:yes gene_type:complete